MSSMAPGTSKVVYLTVLVGPSVPPTAVLSNSVTVSSATPDLSPGNNTDIEATDVDTQADLWLDKTTSQAVGELITGSW